MHARILPRPPSHTPARPTVPEGAASTDASRPRGLDQRTQRRRNLCRQWHPHAQWARRSAGPPARAACTSSGCRRRQRPRTPSQAAVRRQQQPAPAAHQDYHSRAWALSGASGECSGRRRDKGPATDALSTPWPAADRTALCRTGQRTQPGSSAGAGASTNAHGCKPA